MEGSKTTPDKKGGTTQENKVLTPDQKIISGHAPVNPYLQLQQKIGNQEVQRLFMAGVLQAKLNISKPGDAFEQEADRVAEKVVRMTDPVVQPKIVQRRRDEEESNRLKALKIKTFVHPQPNEEKEETLPAKEAKSHTQSTAPNVESSINSLKGSGQPLDRASRAYFEPRFGYDFSQVRVHTGPRAAESARAINAKAFTLGQDVVFGAGQYKQQSSEGLRLLAHELTHVVQNNSFIALQPADKPPGMKGFAEGQGMFQDDDYLVWGTWQEGDTTSSFLERLIPQWVVWRYGNVVDAGVRDRIVNYLLRLTKVSLQPASNLIPGNQYFIWLERPTIGVVDTLVNGDKATRENIRKEGGKQAQKREEQAGLSNAAAGRAAAKAQQGPPPPEANKTQAPVPINESTYIPEKKTGLNAYKPNAQALPAKITGPDMQSLGGIGTYRMNLDYSIAGSDQLSQVLEAMNWVDYHWERFDITPIVENGMREQVEKEKKRQTISGEAEVGTMAAAGRRAVNAVNDIKEDVSHTASDLANPVKASTTGDAGDVVAKVLANYDSLVLLPASAIIDAGGVALGALADLMGGTFQEREIPWPKREGYFLIRCIAQPSPQGPQGEQQRYASVAVKTVEVRDVNKLAVNALDMPQTKIEEKELDIMIANLKQPPDPEEISRLTGELEYLKKAASAPAQDVIKAKIDEKEAELKTATGYRKQKIEEELKILRSQKELADKRVQGLQGIVRPQASFASKVTGETYPLLLQLGLRGTDGGIYIYELSDVTSRDTRAPYMGKGKDAQTAAWNAVRDFAGHNDYGRGTIAIRLPEGAGFQFSQTTIESAPRDTELVKKRMNDLVTILVVLGLFVPGVGEAAAVLGAGLAAEHLYARFKARTLRLDTSVVSDVIGVLGAVAVGMGTIAKFRLVKSAKGFVLAAEEGEAKALQEAVEAMAGAQKFAKGTALGNKIFMAGGVIWGNLEALNTIMETNQSELQGKISHAQARRSKTQAVMNSIQNNLLVVAAGMSGPKESAGPKKPGQTMDNPPVPTNAPKTTPPSEPGAPKPGETSVIAEPKDVSGPVVVPKETTGPVTPPKDLPPKEPVPKESAPVTSLGETTAPANPVPEAAPTKPKVAAVATAADGINQIEVLEDGSIIRNSSEPLRNTYDEVLKSAGSDRQALARDLDNRLKAVEQKANIEDPLAKQDAAKEAAALETDLRNFATHSLATETGITQKNMQKLTEVFNPNEIRMIRDYLGLNRFNNLSKRGKQPLRYLARAWNVSAADPVVWQAIMEIAGMDPRLMTVGKMETALTDLTNMQTSYAGKFNITTLQAYLKALRRGNIAAAKAELENAIDVIEGKKPAPTPLTASDKKAKPPKEPAKTPSEPEKEPSKPPTGTPSRHVDPKVDIKKALIKRQIEEKRSQIQQFYLEIQEPVERGRRLTREERKTIEREKEELARQVKEVIKERNELLDQLSELDITPYERARAYSYSETAASQVTKRSRGLDEVSGKKPFEPSIDHIVSIDEITSMEGYNDLSKEAQNYILSKTDNLCLMEKSLNSSKGNKRWANWEVGRRIYGEEAWSRMVERENMLRRTIQDEIKALSKKR